MSLKTAFVAMMLLVAPPVLAHEVDKGPNGGRVVEAGIYHVELVVKGDAVTIFLSDSDEKPVAAKGFKAIALLTVAGKPHRIVLQVKDTLLVGTSPVRISGLPRGVVQLTGPDGKTLQARYR